MRFAPRLLNILSKFHFCLAGLLVGIYALVLLLTALFVGLFKLEGMYDIVLTEPGTSLSLLSNQELLWMGLSFTCLGVLLWGNGLVFRALKEFTIAKLDNARAKAQASHLKSVPKYLLVVYISGLLLSLVDSLSRTLFGSADEVTSLELYAEFVLEHIIPLFSGASSLVFAALIHWYTLNLLKTSELEDETTRLQHEAELTI